MDLSISPAHDANWTWGGDLNAISITSQSLTPMRFRVPDGTEAFWVQGVNSAVNYIAVTNAVAGDSPSISSVGDGGLAFITDNGGEWQFQTDGAPTISFLRTDSLTPDLPNAEAGVFSFQGLNSSAAYVEYGGFGLGVSDDTAGNETAFINFSSRGQGGSQATSLQLHSVASAVNYLIVTNALTTESPSVKAAGTDANIGILLQPKVEAGEEATVTISDANGVFDGFIQFRLDDEGLTKEVGFLFQEPTNGFLFEGNVNDTQAAFASDGVPMSVGTSSAHDVKFFVDDTDALIITGVPSAVNYLTVSNSITEEPPEIAAAGADEDIPLRLRPKGDSGVQFTPGAGADEDKIGFGLFASAGDFEFTVDGETPEILMRGGIGGPISLINSQAFDLIFGTNDTTRWTIDDSEGGSLVAAGSQFIEMNEMTAPAAPAANKGRVFFQDNGAGKTQLCVRFATGAATVIATEP
jgi:hypothetical protein